MDRDNSGGDMLAITPESKSSTPLKTMVLANTQPQVNIEAKIDAEPETKMFKNVSSGPEGPADSELGQKGVQAAQVKFKPRTMASVNSAKKNAGISRSLPTPGASFGSSPSIHRLSSKGINHLHGGTKTSFPSFPSIPGARLAVIVDPAHPFSKAEVVHHPSKFTSHQGVHFAEPVVKCASVQFLVEYLTTPAGMIYLDAFFSCYQEFTTAKDIVTSLHRMTTYNSSPLKRRAFAADDGLTYIYCDESEELHGQEGLNNHESAEKNSLLSSDYYSALFGGSGFESEINKENVINLIRFWIFQQDAVVSMPSESLHTLKKITELFGSAEDKDLLCMLEEALDDRSNNIPKDKPKDIPKSPSQEPPKRLGSNGIAGDLEKARQSTVKKAIGIMRRPRASQRENSATLNKKERMVKPSSFRFVVPFAEARYRRRYRVFGHFSPYREKHIALQLSAQLYETYSKITVAELMTLSARQSSKNVQKMIYLFNQYSWWCVTWILLGPAERSSNDTDVNVPDKVERLLYVLRIAEECRALHSFHIFFGLMGGLCQPQLFWIWEFAKEKDKTRFNDLKRAISPDNDYRVYRADVSKCSDGSYIPFLGYTTKVLFMLESSVKARSEDYPELVNFSRCISLYSTVQEFLMGKKDVQSKNSGFAMFFSALKADGSKLSKKMARLQKLLQQQLSNCYTADELSVISEEEQQLVRTSLVQKLENTGFL